MITVDSRPAMFFGAPVDARAEGEVNLRQGKAQLAVRGQVD